MADNRIRRHTRRVRSTLGLLVVSAVVVTGCGLTGSDDAGGGPDDERRSAQLPEETEPTVAPDPDATTTTTLAEDEVSAIRDLDLSAVPLRLDCLEGIVEVTFGQDTPDTDGMAQVLGDWRTVYGDATGDGRDDALISAACSPADGGNVFTVSVAVVSAPDGAEPAQVGDPIPGFEPTASGGTLTVQQARPEGDDPTCCPSTIDTKPWQLVGDAWQLNADGLPLSPGDQVTSDGVGAARVGATLPEVAIATGRALSRTSIDMPGRPCFHITFDGIQGVEAVAADTGDPGDPVTLEAIVLTDPSIALGRGIRVGSTREEVEEAFPDAVARDGALILEQPDGERVVILVFDPDGANAETTPVDTVTEIRVGGTGPASGGRCQTF